MESTKVILVIAARRPHAQKKLWRSDYEARQYKTGVRTTVKKNKAGAHYKGKSDKETQRGEGKTIQTPVRKTLPTIDEEYSC